MRYTCLALASSLLISACASTNAREEPVYIPPHQVRVQNILNKLSAPQAQPQYAALSAARKAYEEQPDNSGAVITYVKALKDTGDLDKAHELIAPQARQYGASTETLSTYGSVLLAQKKYEEGEFWLQNALELDEHYGWAHYYMGVALDARNEHELAEQSFRRALSTWQGNQSEVMRALGLNLAVQEKFEEATAMLEQAKIIALDKTAIERNLRMVNALQQTEYGWVPKPKARPQSAKPEAPSSDAPQPDEDAE